MRGFDYAAGRREFRGRVRRGARVPSEGVSDDEGAFIEMIAEIVRLLRWDSSFLNVLVSRLRRLAMVCRCLWDHCALRIRINRFVLGVILLNERSFTHHFDKINE